MNAPARLLHDISIQGVRKVFPLRKRALEALASINLTVAAGEFLSIVGGSGCGKSTLLRLIAGLDAPTSGAVMVGNAKVTGPGLDRGMVFQESRLYPWQNVEENIAFGLNNGTSAGERARIVREHVDLVGLRGFEKAFPHQLSGGMQQRVSIARALVNRPEILLLDEPFGALDALTRIEMQNEVLRIWRAEGTTMILVTHDIDEAVFLGDRVVVMSPRPGTIKRILDIPLPRPRDRNDPDFSSFRQEIYGEFFASSERTPVRANYRSPW